MRMNKKQLAAKLGVSERSITAWQTEGFPIQTQGPRGKKNEYDLAAVVAWIKKTGRGTDYRMNGQAIDVAALERELAISLPPPPAPSSRPQDVVFAEQMFKIARTSLDAGEFEKIEFAMRMALARVPDELRPMVRLDFEVMDRLTATVNAALGEEVEADQIARGEHVKKEMNDAEADEMGIFWYQVASGEWHVSDDRDSGGQK